ncbi:MAG: hypothetical protein NVSMB27_23030 [Ktedonobacteraceae bacterium]
MLFVGGGIGIAHGDTAFKAHDCASPIPEIIEAGSRITTAAHNMNKLSTVKVEVGNT